MKLLLALALLGSLQVQSGSRVVEMFYDPAGMRAGPIISQGTTGLRGIPAVRPFPPYGNVGIHYWFENDAGTRRTEEQAAADAGTFSLHVRSNTDGYLSVWSINAETGSELTPPKAGVLIGTAEYVVPNRVRFGSDASAGRLLFLFSRSQTEQVTNPTQAVQKVQKVMSGTAPDGLPELVRASDSDTLGQLGTYVVSRTGMPVAAAIALKSQ